MSHILVILIYISCGLIEIDIIDYALEFQFLRKKFQTISTGNI